jgi:periplasmic copper chaperone A
MLFVRRFMIGSFLALSLIASPALAETKMATAELGALKLTDGWLKIMVPGAKVAGGYLTIENTGTEADRLVALKTAFAKKNEIHEMAMNNDVMTMRPLADGLDIPAGETVILKPGSFHLMFMGVTDPIEANEENEITLVFEKAGEITISFPALEGAMHSGH